MSDHGRGDFSMGLFAGRLEGISFPDLLWALHSTRKTGVLALCRDGRTKSLYLEDGGIVFAASDDPNDRLGELFLRQGRIGMEHLDGALERLHTGKRLGAILVEDGSLTPEGLVQGVLDQVQMIVLDLFEWDEGEYRFDEGALPTDEVITVTMRTTELLLHGIRRIKSFTRIRRSVGTSSTVYGLAPGARDLLRDLTLTEGEELLIVRLEQGDECIDALCREVFLSNFEIYQTLWALRVIGAVEQRTRRDEPSVQSTLAGRLLERNFAEVLIEACRTGDEGVLYVNRRARERTFHIRYGRCVFATSNDPDDGLVAYLLRRGVISLGDREETAKRLLTNKRVGTILLELGVIDDTDLQEMVRQHLKEIVYDTFQWETGDFAFVPGKLPSVEEIVLDPTLEALVADGLRRVHSWRRIAHGCGGLDQPLGITPAYLDVLDGMRAGPDDWRLVNALKQPRSAKQICRELDDSDFTICQTLWTLRVLGAVEPVERLAHGEAQPAAADPMDLPEIAPAFVEDAGEVEAAAPEPGDDDVERRPDESEDAPVEPEFEAASREESPEEPARDEEPAPFENPLVEAAPEEEFGEDRQDTVAVWTAEPDSTDRVEVVELDERAIEAPEIQVVGTGDDLGGEPEIEVHRFMGATDDEADRPALVEPDRSPDETQVISAEMVAAALRASDHEQELSAEEENTMGTVRIAREDVDMALEGGERSPDDTQEILDNTVAAADPWEPPPDLDEAIAMFNAVQRVVFRAVRSEVGAGAANFIRTCCERDEAAVEALQQVELLSDGTWDTEDLRRVAVQQRIDEPWNVYQQLIELELDQLRSVISEASATELERRVADVVQPG